MFLSLLLVQLVAARPVYEVPYTLAATNHILLRAKLNGSGPYNFIMDTGAPALFVAEGVAKRLGIRPNTQHWGVVDRLEIEGGPVVEKIGARVEGPFQLQTMNQLALTGVEIHGVIGYNVLARYRIEIDMTRPTLSWTASTYSPKAPAAITSAQKQKMAAPIQNQKQMESMAKMAGAMFARNPTAPLPRGFLGIEVADGNSGVLVKCALPDGPAARAGVLAEDVIVSFTLSGKPAVSVGSAAFLIEKLRGLAPDDVVTLSIHRGGETRTIPVRADKGAL